MGTTAILVRNSQIQGKFKRSTVNTKCSKLKNALLAQKDIGSYYNLEIYK